MAYTEISRTGYFGRIGNAIGGVIFGFVLFLVSFIVLFMNEGRAVHTARTLEEGKSAVVSIDSAKVDSQNEGKLVHFTGRAINAGGDKLADPVFHITEDAIHLRRDVAMYQWKEESKTETRKDAVGGGETKRTTYTYSRVWSDKPIDSSHFKEDGHDNPEHWRLKSDAYDAAKVTAGAFTLNSELAGKIDNFTDVSVSKQTIAGLDDELKADTVYSDNALYISNEIGKAPDPESTKIGDLKVSFKAALPGDVSVIAKQTAAAVAPYQTKNDTINMLYVGAHSADEMFKSEMQKNTTLTWLLRVVGFVMMWIGLAMMLNPLKVLSDVIGIVGDLVGAGIALVTGVIAIALSFFVIAVAWVTYRPVVGIGLLVIAGAAVAGFIHLRGKAAAKRKAMAPAPATA